MAFCWTNMVVICFGRPWLLIYVFVIAVLVISVW